MASNNTYSKTEMSEVSGIKTSLLKLHSFQDEQLSLFTEKLTFKKLKKNSFLIKPGQISNRLSFINRGSLRFYTHTEQGELTINFFTENQWTADIESLLTQQPSENYIEALENADIASITLKDMHELMDIYPSFLKLNALIANLTIPTKHLAAISTKNPDMRYKELLLKHPDWINRFPQMQLASYLGMTPETLSRVRRRIA
jgi:CRP-like cAMP-binding protein